MIFSKSLEVWVHTNLLFTSSLCCRMFKAQTRLLRMYHYNDKLNQQTVAGPRGSRSNHWRTERVETPVARGCSNACFVEWRLTSRNITSKLVRNQGLQDSGEALPQLSRCVVRVALSCVVPKHKQEHGNRWTNLEQVTQSKQTHTVNET